MESGKLFEGHTFDPVTKVRILMLLFVTGGISGWLYEMGFYRINFGYFVKRGHGLGPWLPIYAFGSLMILFAASRFRKRPWAVFLVCAGVTGLLEYLTGWVLYTFFGGLRLWDYNTEIWNWGNIGGYICFRSILVFALAGLALVYLIFPLLCRLAERTGRTFFACLSTIPFAAFVIDMFVGYFVKGL